MNSTKQHTTWTAKHNAALGQNIRKHRTISGLSQTALGEAIGITFQQLQKYEKGVNRITAARLYQIALVLELDLDNLFRGDVFRESAIKYPSESMLEMTRAFEQIQGKKVRISLLRLIRSAALAKLSAPLGANTQSVLR
ncbi:helix-turn-helix domain-containing protein [Pelagibius sp. Alg239-R121]|uniref:helix-turn-helix domain-containing protein n=1 Tax=Pelagibius sp. Alg239-R121 TaxID=2993448 RepID=UPI0024A70919|nr:helix-turn-helix transcriptional regulator [Pelagibius sp. Alg239-R121]